MNPQTHKCVLIIDESLTVGIITNVASILSITIGDRIKGMVGPDVADKEGFLHAGLTVLPIPVLGGTREQIKSLRDSYTSLDADEGFLVDFNQIAQQSRNYQEYTERLHKTDLADITYLGIALYGDKKRVNAATKGLKLIGAEI